MLPEAVITLGLVSGERGVQRAGQGEGAEVVRLPGGGEDRPQPVPARAPGPAPGGGRHRRRPVQLQGDELRREGQEIRVPAPGLNQNNFTFRMQIMDCGPHR